MDSVSLTHRLRQLRRLKKAVEQFEGPLLTALADDVGKSAVEAYASEIGIVHHEIDNALRHLPKWVRRKRVRTPLVLFPGRSFITYEPYGTVLIIAPWNYPVNLALSPLVGALAAGNRVVVKPSEMSLHTSAVLAEMIGEHFDPAEIRVVEGGVDKTKELLAQRFDYIFFTGGTKIGKIIMTAAAQHLTPVTLELGGKNPCIVEQDAPLAKTARRIAWGKFFNAGQTCLAPDYVVVHRNVKEPFLDEMRKAITQFYGCDPRESPDYGRIINDGHFQRLRVLLDEGDIVIGGGTDRDALYIDPTVIDGIEMHHRIMEEEIFGPLLPVMTYDDLSVLIDDIGKRPKPLACYFFSTDRNKQQAVLAGISAGGVSINDTFAHFINSRLPFGGVGDSGMGAYHGRYSFETFSHAKSVYRGTFLFDTPMKFPPYTVSLSLIKRAFRFLY